MLKRLLVAVAAISAAGAGVAGHGSNPGLKQQLQALIAKSGADVAVAYRTLDGRDELLINPDVEFHAASTMKVPVMIELFRQARAGALSLDDRIPVVNEFHSIVDGSPFALSAEDDSEGDVYKRVGQTMTYRELCEAMITSSSNFAANLLIEKLDAKRIQQTTDALGASGMHVLRGVEDNKAFEKGLNNTTTARALMTLLQKIAAGDAVDRTASAEMVAVLKRQRFNDRIPAGLPAGIPVAHKTGEITKIQHDAAIVYAPRPYVLVVLVRGLQDQKEGSALTADISRAVYQASQRNETSRDETSVAQPFRAALAQAGSTASNSTAQLLTDIIRVDSSNPPGKNAGIGELLAARMKPLGFEIEIVPTPDPGKTHFFARLRGDGSKRPVLIAAHGDVVGVERDKWTVDPFAGTIKDGHVYGRGAIDFKGGVAVFARAAMLLAENKVPLARDVIFLSEADEEGARYSTSWLAEQHWPQMECEFALNEGGWIIEDQGKVKYVSISTADKGGASVLVTAHGTSTHSSMPRPDNAIFTLARALAKLAAFDPKIEMIPETKQFFLTLAKTSAPPMSGYYRTLATSTDPAALARADREVSKDPLLHAFIRNTIAPVLINGGFRSNVIPGSAEATINVRTIPGTDVNALVEGMQRAVGDPNVEVKLSGPAFGGLPPSTTNSELFRALEREARATFPGAEVTPYLFQAGTDAIAWRSRGVPVYGIYPYPITAEELTRMHGNDERVSVQSLEQGTRMIYQTLVDVAGKAR